ncbi:MAG: right-handed parallel beta-helix repeat-containing protein [Ilumatobacteraceae bacterium]
MTARNYTVNGFYWTEVEGYRGSYLTAIRNGDYGVYAFDSTKGQFDNSYASGSPDAGFYIGQCFPCDAVLDNVIAEHNGLGYSGTNAGGNLVIANSVFRNNRVGVVPNSGSYELCYPQRDNVIVGNLVYDNNQPDTPAIDVARLAQGNGILAAGGVDNVIERNRVYDHDRTGIALVPFPEEEARDDEPSQDEWDTTCAEQRTQPLADELPSLLLWDSWDNRVVGNDVSGSGLADIAVASVSTDLETLRNCFGDNVHDVSAPAELESLAPCDGAEPTEANWKAGTLDVASWLAEQETMPESVDYQEAPLPLPPQLDNMPGRGDGPAASCDRRADGDRRRRDRDPRTTVSRWFTAGAVLVLGACAGPTSASPPAAPDAIHLGPQGNVGQFVVQCAPSHAGFDDPILYPGQPGASHLHQFFGNPDIDAMSTSEDDRPFRDVVRSAARHGLVLGARTARRER